jgi:hypothetical protein
MRTPQLSLLHISSHFPSFHFHRSCQCFRTKRVLGSSFNVDYRVSGFRGKQLEVAVVVAIRCTPSCWPGKALADDIHYDGLI